MREITPQMKDIVLADLMDAESPSFISDYNDSMNTYGFEPQYVKLILDDFDERGLIKVMYFMGNKARIQVTAKAYDLFRHGGFVVEEEILKGNIEKLGYEIDWLVKQLSPNYAEKASQLATIGSAIIQALTIFK